MMRLRSLAVAAIAVATIGWFLVETRRVAQLAGEHEVAARQAAQALAGEQAERVRAEQHRDRLTTELRRLELELDGALDYARAIGEAMTAEAEARERAAVARAAAQAIVDLPPERGVQRCLDLLRECLRRDGFTGLRPLRARAVVDFELRDIELLDADAIAFGADLIVAGRMTAKLDRAAGALTLTFHDGSRRLQGVRTALPPEGLAVRFAPVEGRMWEAQLPFLVRAEGEYPAAAAAMAAVERRLDAETRAEWLERLDALLAVAGTDLELRIGGFSGLQDGRFRSARLFGYDRGRLLSLAADCDELAVEIDERAGIVSLLLRSGTLRREGVQSTIQAEGYRMLLPNLTPQKASDCMLGMVVRR